MTPATYTIRELGYSDLPQVISIERRAFTTPWSLAMFVLEVSKPTGVCLAAVDISSARVLGYLILSRYDTVWHLMNIAVDPKRRREGIARGLLDAMIVAAGPASEYTLEVRTSNTGGDRALRAVRFPLRRNPAAVLPRHRRGRRDHVAHQRHRLELEAGVILGIETSCDDTCAAVITGDGRILANVISSQGIHDRYGGVVPEIASRQHLELIGAAVEDALTQARTTLSGVELVAVTRGPGLVAALLVGFATAKALAAAHELPLAAVDHLHGHVAAGFLAPEPVVPPFLSLVASGGHTFLARVT